MSNISFINGYNPSHLGGFGDLIKSAVQADQGKGAGIEDFDARTILMQIAPQVTTQKILLVGHSQGTFYTNALYDYLTKHGVSKDAIGVYNIATPANYVAGDGSYLTSSNDRVVKQVALILEAEVAGLAPLIAQQEGILDPIIARRAPLTPNITLSPGPNPGDTYAGHSMGAVYLAEAPERIVSDIERALSNLRSSGADANGGCFAPPPADFKYQSEQAGFAIADPLASGMFVAIGGGLKTLAAVAKAGYNTAAAALSSGASGVRSLLPSPTKETAISAFPVVRFLYGSGVDQPGLNDLNNDATFYSGTAPARQPSAVALAPAAPRPAPQAPVPAPTSQLPAPPKPAAPINPFPQLMPISPGFGGGGSAPQPEPEQASAPAPTPAAASALAIISPADNALSATTSVSIVGTSTPDALVFASFGSTLSTTTADGAGNWAFSLALPEGITTVSFSVLDAGASGTTTLARSVTVDTTPPAAPAVTSPSGAAGSVTTISGSAEEGSTVLLSVDAVSATTTAEHGTWSFTGSFPSASFQAFLSATDAAGNTSATTTKNIAISQNVTNSTSDCSRPFSASGYFFESAASGYESGYPAHHFKNAAAFSDGRNFTVTWSFADDECNATASGGSSTISLPPGHTDWSVIFSSASHFDVRDDADATALLSVDIPAVPGYTNALLGATIDSGASAAGAAGETLVEHASAPSFVSTIAQSSACTAGAAAGYFFDDFERAEYVDDLLRVHVRLNSPYNDGRTFTSAALVGAADCVVPASGTGADTSLPAYMRYYSFRMTSATHWVLWNDEKDEQIFCAHCEGDISPDAAYVSFYGVIDGGASTLRTTPFFPRL